VSDYYCLHHDKLVPELARIYVRKRDRELQKRVVVEHTASETDPLYEQHWKTAVTMEKTKQALHASGHETRGSFFFKAPTNL
jgi:hypothetical protein